MKSKYLLFSVVLIIYLLFTDKSLAKTDLDLTINYPAINPTSFLYPVKRIWEKAFPFILFSQKSKLDYNQGLLKERLAELKYVAEKKLLSDIEKSSQRFAYQAGVTVEGLKNLNDKNKINQTLEDFKSYNKILASLRDFYQANSSFWMLIQQDIDTLNILSGKIKN